MIVENVCVLLFGRGAVCLNVTY